MKPSVAPIYWLPILLIFLLGCPKKEEVVPEEDLVVIDTDAPSSTYDQLLRAHRNDLRMRNYRAGDAGLNPYSVDEFVVLYEDEDIANAVPDSARLAEIYGSRFREVKSCGCLDDFQVRLWRIDSIGGTERGRGGSDKVANDIGKESDGVSPNYYLFPQRPNNGFNSPAFTRLPQAFQPTSHPAGDDPIVIALLDSGVDLQLQGRNIPGQGSIYFWRNPNETARNGASEGPDPFCLPDDLIGWDFVNGDNNPNDDNSHGTHVAGIIAKQLTENAPDLPFTIMPLKVLDQNGVGTSFDATCAVLYAAFHRADIINASWGFYGDPDPLLERALERAEREGIFTSTGAGNDRVNLNEVRHFPGQFGLRDNNVIRGVAVVGGLNGDKLWNQTNFRTDGDVLEGIIAAPAEEVESLVPTFVSPDQLATKSGTSMSAAYLTALAATYRRLRPDDRPGVMRHNLLRMIVLGGTTGYFRSNGERYPYYPFDWFEVGERYETYRDEMRVN